MPTFESGKLQKGWKAEDFNLLNIDGSYYSLNDLKGENGTIIAFICNHCPFVKAILDDFITDAEKLCLYGVKTIAIMPNNVDVYPDDSFENMQKLSKSKGIFFPYLYDETQLVAKDYDAVCTPDFFGFNKNLELQYRGRFDANGISKNYQSNKHELLEAMIKIVETGEGPLIQNPSVGCSIKWKKSK